MNLECPHENVSNAGPPFLCYACAAVRDTPESPWRALTERERLCNMALGAIAGAFMKGRKDIIFNDDTPACILIDDGETNYEIQIYRMAQPSSQEVAP